MRRAEPSHWFIAPALRGALSGGTLYNRGLLAALRRGSSTFQRVDLKRGLRLLERGIPGTYWLDSLYLDAFGDLLRARRGGQRLGLLLHYLPALVRRGDAAAPEELSGGEQRALREADVLLVPSTTLRDAARRFGAAAPILVVEPARPRVAAHPADPHRHGVRAVLIGNVVPGKGVHELLAALARELGDDDPLTLNVIGDASRDSTYAARCAAAVQGSARLCARVTFAGALAPAPTLRRLAASNALVSSSVYESYGMALAEARAAGIPLLARAGGHSAAHVDARAGGELVFDHDELARACVRLARDPAEHARRIAGARAERYAARPWADAAQELMAQLAPWPS